MPVAHPCRASQSCILRFWQIFFSKNAAFFPSCKKTNPKKRLYVVEFFLGVFNEKSVRDNHVTKLHI